MPRVSDALVVGDDGKARCYWSCSAPEYIAYHDEEWGRPVTTDQGLYERMTLEAFQSGLAWITILRKREGFRAAFAGFDIDTVAGFGEADVARLMADAGIVRNRLKIEAAINNARAAQDVGLAELIWSHAPDPLPPRPRGRSTRTSIRLPTYSASASRRRAAKRRFAPVTRAGSSASSSCSRRRTACSRSW